MATAQTFYLQQGLSPPYMPSSVMPYAPAESSPKPSFFRKPFFSSGSSGGSRPPGKGFFRLRTPSFLSGLRGSASSPKPSFFSFGRPSQQQPQHQPQPIFAHQIPVPPLQAAAAHATFQTLPMPGGPRFTFAPEAVLQHAPTHIAQATEFAESQMDSDRAPGGFPGLSSLFQPQASESFGSSVGDQDSFQQQVNSVMQISPSSNNGYGFKTEGSSVYNGIMTAQLGVPVSLSNYGDGPVAIPVGATRGQQGGDGSGSDSQSYTPSAEIYTQSQGSSGQKTQSSSADQYSTYAAAFQAQPTSSGYGQSSSSGTRYSSAPSSDPTIAFYTPQSSSGFGGSPQTYTLSSGGGYVSSAPSAFISGLTSGYETSITNHGSGSSKYGPAYSLVGSGNYPTSSSGSYGSSQPSSYSSSSGAYSPSSYGSSASHYTVPTRTYTSSQPSSGYSSSYSSGSPSKYSTSGSAYSSGYGSSSSSSLPSSSVAYDNSQSNYGSYGQRYPSSAYSTSSQSAYSPKRPATNYASTSTSYKNSQAAAAVAQALKAYAAGNVKYGSTKSSSPSADSSYSTSYSGSSGSSSYGDKSAAAPYFRAKTSSSTYNKYGDASLGYTDSGSDTGSSGSKTSSKSSYDQRTVGQTLRVSGDSTNSSDAYTTSTRNTSSTPSKSSTV
ncbi:hypothetical protein HPB51_005432 [Rhipicephalus microplus]|uniref:Uncharacterized protein n=2 Tax=Rhipicephalus microplus TaxID=6941 RepID=A0A9J6DTD0_RHIMP|nr:hypothetical protein HPB51_005432 [Rhipicephalus microplus]